MRYDGSYSQTANIGVANSAQTIHASRRGIAGSPWNTGSWKIGQRFASRAGLISSISRWVETTSCMTRHPPPIPRDSVVRSSAVACEGQFNASPQALYVQ